MREKDFFLAQYWNKMQKIMIFASEFEEFEFPAFCQTLFNRIDELFLLEFFRQFDLVV